jgi:hypothetical protein
MLIIPIDDLKKKSGSLGDPEPKMTMRAAGLILCNIAAAKLLKMEEGPNFIHFYENNENLYIKKDNDPKHAIRIMHTSKSAKCAVYNKNVANYFINKLMPEDKSITFLISDADYGKFSITPIIP